MNRKEKQPVPAVPAAEYFVLYFKENKSFVTFSLFFVCLFVFPLVVEDRFFWLDTAWERNSQACNSLEQAVSLQSNYGLLWIRINNLSEPLCVATYKPKVCPTAVSPVLWSSLNLPKTDSIYDFLRSLAISRCIYNISRQLKLCLFFLTPKA